MKALISSFCAVALVVAMAAPAALAQRSALDDWATVQSVTPGDEIVITLKTEKETKGKFLDAGAGEVSVERKGKRESIAKDTIAQIHLIKGKAKKGQWALIGAGVGAGTGFGIGQTKNGPNVDDGQTYVFVGTLLGTGIGAATGYLFGMSRRRRELIYLGR
jgi:myo-inositol-hexaphosphate 3-phosphohydrolase